MAKLSKTSRRLIIVLIAVVGITIVGWQFWKAKQSELPKGIASGNGRIEAKLVDATAKEPLRVKEILVDEGDLVKPGQVVVRLDTSTLEAELAAGKAQLAASQEQLAVASASIVRRKSEIRLARIEED